MVFKFLRGLAGRTEGGAEKPGPQVDYKGFSIQPAPQRQGSGWNTAGVISKEVEGEVKTHHFIRVDTHSSRDDAESFSVTKAKQIIDEQGEALFREK
ncbi:MAG: HlyU family transcriptional regulator [Alphaproteobacteria bacterium]